MSSQRTAPPYNLLSLAYNKTVLTRIANYEIIIAYTHRDRDRQMGRRNKKQEAERQALLEDYNHACAACGSPLDLEVDHVIPTSKGGPDTYENKQILCHHCNNAKNGTAGIPKFAPRKMVDSCTQIAVNRTEFLKLLLTYR